MVWVVWVWCKVVWHHATVCGTVLATRKMAACPVLSCCRNVCVFRGNQWQGYIQNIQDIQDWGNSLELIQLEDAPKIASEFNHN